MDEPLPKRDRVKPLLGAFVCFLLLWIAQNLLVPLIQFFGGRLMGLTVGLLLSAALNVNSTVITHINPNPPQLPASVIVIDRQQQGYITRQTPDSKLVLSAAYSWKRLTVTPSITRYGTYAYLDETNPALDQTFGPQWVTDMSVAYQVNPTLKLTVGGHNLFNTFPNQQIAAERSPQVSLYSELAPDGAFGTFLFVRLSASLP